MLNICMMSVRFNPSMLNMEGSVILNKLMRRLISVMLDKSVKLKSASSGWPSYKNADSSSVLLAVVLDSEEVELDNDVAFFCGAVVLVTVTLVWLDVVSVSVVFELSAVLLAR